MENQKEFLQIIDEETDRLQELLDNMLDSARLQNGSMSNDTQPVRIEALLRDVITTGNRTSIQYSDHDRIPGSAAWDQRR